MKTSRDPRHILRVKTLQSLFTWEFAAKNQSSKIVHKPILGNKLSKDIITHLSEIDKEVKKSAPEWPLEQINKIDLAILRLSVFELIIKKEQPFKVIVDEAVELAKEFGSESSSAFINGVLGKIITEKEIK